MTKSSRILILSLALCALASCVMPKAAPNDCAGWRKITLSAEAVDYLAANDPDGLRKIIAHNETGQARGCW